jgi:hypothetical protein
MLSTQKMPKFSCEVCNYQTDKKFNYMNHLESKKHEQKTLLHKQAKMTTHGDRDGDGDGEVDSKNKFFCETCNFVCYKISNYEKHLKTEKHILSNSSTKCNVSEMFVCKNCNLEYSSRSGLWRHKQKCCKTSKYYQCDNEKSCENENANENANDDCNDHEHEIKEKEKENKEDAQEKSNNYYSPPMQNIITPELVMMIFEQNKQMQQMMLEHNKEQSKTIIESVIEIVKGMGNTTTNNNSNNTQNNTQNNNKSFNLNFFLNETCKDAMNMSDFVKNLHVTPHDFEQTGLFGYVEGMCRILENGLNKLEVHERPIHCTDAKRETIYIKDNDKWEKDDDKKTKLLSVVKQVGAKNINAIPQWCKEHPGWSDSESKENDRYLKYVFNSMCGGTDEEIYKNYGDIMRYMCRITAVDKKEAIAL